MKEQELDRFIYNEYEYHISHEIFTYKEYKISYPSILVTTKTSKKNRGKKPTKTNGHYSLINHKNPFPLIRKICKIFEDHLCDYDFVCFTAYNEKAHKREQIYEYYLHKMGYKTLYEGGGYYFLSKNVFNLKKREINKILWCMYQEFVPNYDLNE